MFKNISLYIFLSLLIAASCSFITYNMFYNPFSFSDNFLLWMIRLLIYILLAWWLTRLSTRTDKSEISVLAFIIPVIAININGFNFHTLHTLLGVGNETYQKLMCYVCFIIVLGWLLKILFTKNKTLFGFLIVLNTIITIYIIFPYGIPRVDISVKDGFNFDSFTFPCFPYYTLHNYRPFVHKENSALLFFLDIRTITLLVFFGYEIIHSVIQTTKIKYFDNLEEGIKRTENSIQQFFIAGLYFVWNIIRRFLFFTKSFWIVFKRNLWGQIRESIDSYIYVIYIFFAFFAPFVIFKLSSLIFGYNKTTSIIFFSLTQAMVIIIITFLFLFPLLLVKLLKAQLNPFKLYNLNVSERPILFLPIYISFLGIGLTSIISCFIEKSFGLYLLLFLGVILYAAIWGYANFRKSK